VSELFYQILITFFIFTNIYPGHHRTIIVDELGVFSLFNPENLSEYATCPNLM